MLHRYDWSESSLILEVFTRHYGRIALVAKGVKRPSSQFRSILLPFQPLLISFGGETEVRTLKGAEWTGGYTMPHGEALLTGYYLSELLMKLLARDDPHQPLFDAYAAMTSLLRELPMPEAALRAFELMLLREIGLLPSLDASSVTLQSLQSGVRYTLLPEVGLREALEKPRQQAIAVSKAPLNTPVNTPLNTSFSAPSTTRSVAPSGAHSASLSQAYSQAPSQTPSQTPYASLPAAAWQALQTALDGPAPQDALRGVCTALAAPERNALKTQLRSLLHYHCGGKTLRTRQLMMDVQGL